MMMSSYTPNITTTKAASSTKKVVDSVQFALQLTTPRALARYRDRFSTTYTESTTFFCVVTFDDALRCRGESILTINGAFCFLLFCVVVLLRG